MEKIYLIILTALFSIIIGLIGYWLRSAHQESKFLLKELVKSIHSLENTVAEIRIQIEKGVEADIKELKTDIKILYKRSNKNEKSITSLQVKTSK